MLEAVGGEALQVVLEEEHMEEVGIAPLHRDEPGQHHREIQHGAGPPEGAAQDAPLTPERGESQDDEQGQERRDGALGEGGRTDKEIKVEEPEPGAGLVPGIPAQHADAERGGELHIGGSAAGEAENARAGGGKQRGIEVAAGPEPLHMQVDKDDQRERDGG